MTAHIHPPRVVAVVTGTATGVGKTWLAVQLASKLRSLGVRVVARKPVQSFSPDERGRTDAERLAHATGEPVDVVCPPTRWFEVPMAPPMAAEVLGRRGVTIAELAAEVTSSWQDGPDVALVELVGGIRSPIATDGDGLDLTFSLAPDLVVVVADAGLGTINAVRLTVDALRPCDAPTIVVLNRYDESDDLHVRNAAWLRDHCGHDVVTDLDELTDRLARTARR